MARLLKTRGSEGAGRLLAAEFDGLVRDGATLKLRGSERILQDGDIILFRSADGGVSSGINVGVDAEGLHAVLWIRPWAHLRFGLEPVGDGVYAFRPAHQHMEMFPELKATGAGATKMVFAA